MRYVFYRKTGLKPLYVYQMMFVSFYNNITGVTSGALTTHPSGAPPEFTSGFCLVFCTPLLCLFFFSFVCTFSFGHCIVCHSASLMFSYYYVCVITSDSGLYISPQRYHPSSSHYFCTDMIYEICLFYFHLHISNNVIIIKAKVHTP